MFIESNTERDVLGPLAATAAGATSPRLPDGLVLTETAVATLRRYLDTHGLEDHRIFHWDDFDLHDIQADLGEDCPTDWERLPSLGGGEPVSQLCYAKEKAVINDGGCLRLRKFNIVLARWYWINASGYYNQEMWLIAARNADDFSSLRDHLRLRRKQNGRRVWELVRGAGSAQTTPRVAPDPASLLLDDAIRSRIDSEIIAFFTDPVAAMYKQLNVPYRRGVLLHGPPGNGKTSTIRHIGALLPDVSAMLLRPHARFDSDEFEYIIRRWTRNAPALLVIEDLNWLFKHVNVSTFLNLLDGIEPRGGDGLLLIATTNHPNELDPAINNRPGRFDVVIEMPNPDAKLRAKLFAARLDGRSDPLIDQLARQTSGLSFSHLLEIVRLAGLLAIKNGRVNRNDDDILAALTLVTESHDHAERGFPKKQSIDFGLHTMHPRKS